MANKFFDTDSDLESDLLTSDAEVSTIYPNLTKGILPEIYHFALYTAENEVADRTKGIRSPRIYFVLADYGRIYPLFFDPYHELNPMY